MRKLTDREETILRYVYRYRLLRSRDHIRKLFGGTDRASRTASKLANEGFLFRFHKSRRVQQVFGLGNQGSTYLAQHMGVPRPRVNWRDKNGRLKEAYLEHTLLIADLMIALEIACKGREGVTFIPPEEIFDKAPAPTRERFYGVSHSPADDPFRISTTIRWDGQLKEASIKADWMFGLSFVHRGKRIKAYYFLEADRATMPVTSSKIDKPSLLKKMLVYREAIRERYQGTTILNETFGIKRARTLFSIIPDWSRGGDGELRLQNTLEALEDITEGRGSKQFLFADSSILDAEDILTHLLLDGSNEETTLVPVPKKMLVEA